MGGRVMDNASGRVAPRFVRGHGRAGLAIVGALALAASVSVPAEARIACRQGAQLVGGNYISTPYCEDQYLAEVAREYGMRTSANAIRNNPNLKRDVCRFVGHDIRISHTCPPEGPRGRRF